MSTAINHTDHHQHRGDYHTFEVIDIGKTREDGGFKSRLARMKTFVIGALIAITVGVAVAFVIKWIVQVSAVISV
jgi:hypothetical protein